MARLYRLAVASNIPVIAVVDDESPVRTMLCRVLRLADYQVTAFASGEEFLDSLTARLPACAILDVHMPGVSGIEAAKQIATRCITVKPPSVTFKFAIIFKFPSIMVQTVTDLPVPYLAKRSCR